ncbi:MAG TPA: hypothetical protein VFS21_26605 [Roseiflexaceae bacterium]|nr:hypothetical protein [Roseiflexaceae bacterium]
MLFMYWLLVGSYLGVGLLLVGAVWWLAHVLRRRRSSRQALVCLGCGLALCASVGAMVLYQR